MDFKNVNVDFYKKIAEATTPISENSSKYKEAKALIRNSIPLDKNFDKIIEKPARKIGENLEKIYYTEIEGNSNTKWLLRSNGFISDVNKVKAENVEPPPKN